MAPWANNTDKQNVHHEIVKCVVVGDTAVGKTRLICARACNACLSLSQIVATHIPTIWAIDHYRIQKEVLRRSWKTVDGVNVSLRLWDTFGDHDKDRKFAYGRSDVVLLCFSISNRQSLRNCKTKWLPEIRKHCPNTPIILVGCKNDLRHIYRDKKFLRMCHERSPCVRVVQESDLIPREEAREVAQEIGIPYYETSSLTQFGVDHVFENAIRVALIGRREQRFWASNLKGVKNPQLQMPYCPPRPPKPDIYVLGSSYTDHLLELLESGIKADVRFKLDKEEFMAHTLVLSAASSYFKHLFEDCEQSSYEITTFHWMNKSSMKSFLKFLYAGVMKKEGAVDLDQVLKAAQICKVDDLEDIIQNMLDDKEKLNLEIYEQYIFKLQNNMRDACLNGTIGTDVVFSLDDGKCFANRAILMVRCDYMAAMFKGDFKESNADMVKIPGISRECFLQLLVYLYSDMLDKVSLGINNYVQLLELANCLCLEQLMSLLEEFAVQTIITSGRKGMDVYEHTCTLLEPAQSKMCVAPYAKHILTTLECSQYLPRTDWVKALLSEMHNAYQLSDWCQYFICINYKDVLANYNKLLRGLSPLNQAFLNKNRWPPLSFLKELEYYEGCIRKKEHDENPPKFPKLKKASRKFRKWLKLSGNRKILEAEGLSDSSD